METATEKAPKLTPAQVARVQQEARALFDYMGGDIFAALAEEGKSSMPRSHIVELVLDANRLEEDIRRKGTRKEKPDAEALEIAEWMAKWQYTPDGSKYLTRIVTKAFPHGRYYA